MCLHQTHAQLKIHPLMSLGRIKPRQSWIFTRTHFWQASIFIHYVGRSICVHISKQCISTVICPHFFSCPIFYFSTKNMIIPMSSYTVLSDTRGWGERIKIQKFFNCFVVDVVDIANSISRRYCVRWNVWYGDSQDVKRELGDRRALFYNACFFA